MKPIIEITCIVVQGMATAVLTGAIVGVFFGSAYSAFQWVME